MTAHELAIVLLAGPDLMVTVRGYEGGVDEVAVVHAPCPIHLGHNSQSYYGAHEYHRPDLQAGNCYYCEDTALFPTTSAIHLTKA